MPVGHAPVLGRVLAHGRDHDAVGELEPADLQGFEQLGGGHGDFPLPQALASTLAWASLPPTP